MMTNVRDFGAKGDGKTDDSAALTHAIQMGGGELTFPPGDYVISKPLYILLPSHGRISIHGSGGTARVQMKGAGPAFHLVGSHDGTADPQSVKDPVWSHQRMPMIQDLEIVGAHPNADGIRLEGVMQPVLQGLLIRRCRHGIHLIRRNRNVDISNCHIYENSGNGIYLDGVNLHQINIHGNHISYCKQGGIHIARSEIRNLQISSNDIEYNYDLKAKASADVVLDCRKGTVREGAIVGCTIQAKQSSGGANVRLLGAGKENPNAVGLFTITGNLIGSQESAVHLNACRGVVLSGNCIYSGYHYAIRAEDCEHLVFGSNSLDHNPQYRGSSTDQVWLERCRWVNIHGMIAQHTLKPAKETEATLALKECHAITLAAIQIHGAAKRGIMIENSSVVRVTDSTILSENLKLRASVEVDGKSRSAQINNNFLTRGTGGDVILPENAGMASGNQTVTQ